MCRGLCHALEAMDVYTTTLHAAVFVRASFQHRMSAEVSANLCGEAEQTHMHKPTKLRAQ